MFLFMILALVFRSNAFIEAQLQLCHLIVYGPVFPPTGLGFLL